MEKIMALTIKQINGKIAHLTKSHAKFNYEVQVLLCSIAQYAYEKNVDPVTRLLIVNPDEKDLLKANEAEDATQRAGMCFSIQ
jgi:ubiquinone biosynthesis protein COQ9